MPSSTARALVLAGGGVTGIAWELGVLSALAGAGVGLADADLVLGTSAGAAVGAQITSGAPMSDLLAAQRVPASESKEVAAELDGAVLEEIIGVLLDGNADQTANLAKVGAMARAAETIS